MGSLYLDVSQSATRESILSQIYAQLGEDSAAKVRAAAETAGVPDRMHRHPAEVYETIDGLLVSDRVKADMRAIYEILAAADAAVHEAPLDHVHFHEVGRAAGIRNVVEICLAMEALSPDEVVATPLQAGQGTVHCAHGEMPVPAPATAVILDGCAAGCAGGMPTCEKRLDGELCTPTSVAVLKHFITRYEGTAAVRTYFQGPVPETPHHHHEH